MSENMVLRRIFWSRRDEVTGELNNLYNEELNDVYSSAHVVHGDKIVKNEMGGA